MMPAKHWNYCGMFLWILIPLFSVNTSAQSLRYDQDFSSPWYGHVIVENLKPSQQKLLALDSLNWPNILRVYTKNGLQHEKTQPILGSYKLKGSLFGFKPRFAFEQGTCYQVFSTIVPSAELHFCPEVRPVTTPNNHVTIYPSGKVVPANILRFYIYFDVPMREDNPYNHINLIDSQGDTVRNVLYPAEPALWSSDQKRLTVLLDPGRVKRGLMANNQWGLAFAPELEYFLVIGKKLTDLWGNPLSEDFIHPLLIADADYHSPVLNNWNITVPSVNTLNHLKVAFDEPLDLAQCLRWINIARNHSIVEGTWEIGDNEMWATFVPSSHWAPGSYQLLVFNKLEDRSGNSIRKPFEIRSTDVIENAGWQTLDFEIE